MADRSIEALVYLRDAGGEQLHLKAVDGPALWLERERWGFLQREVLLIAEDR